MAFSQRARRCFRDLVKRLNSMNKENRIYLFSHSIFKQKNFIPVNDESSLEGALKARFFKLLIIQDSIIKTRKTVTMLMDLAVERYLIYTI